MASTVGGALCTLIEAQVASLPCYRDAPGASAALPYVVVLEGLSVVPERHGDGGANPAVRELVQADLWQSGESYGLADTVLAAMHGKTLSASPAHAYGVRVLSRVRVPDPNPDLTHHAFTVEVRRALQ